MQELAIFASLFTAVKGFAAQALTIQNEKKTSKIQSWLREPDFGSTK
jgi:hypothetical protein